MRLHLRDVLERAAERGYTPDEIMPCLVRDLGGGFYDVDVSHPAYPRPREGYSPPRGLGDIVSDWLSSFGITKPRVEAIVGGPCGCDERQEALNEWGARTLGIGRVARPPDQVA
jgi:hypothetical protein